ncbi:MAG: malonic semialdehyde reductase [Alphaproteobacteria bacterium]|jgi:3-hydroxypropanoate dehydrogenase|nr:malonic semialdehyde reductase [Alphaproteobacteria bacterium]
MTVKSENLLELIFIKGRTHYKWLDKPVEDDLLQEVYDLAKLGPTSANSCPMRIVFVKSEKAKAKLKPCLIQENVEKTMTAPVTAIIAYDLEFYEKLPKLFPHTDARSWFVGNAPFIETSAFRNSSLQGAYFMLAARACGLDCGPMSGFDNALVDEAFFHNTSLRSNFLCNLGHGDSTKLYPRSPRLTFDEVCKIR